jgi:4-hydroxy-tetrahydrodipicolinate synthase
MMAARDIHGAGTAIVTPFTHSGELDESALRRFVEWQLEQGIGYIVPCGSTGEAATMTLAEQRRVVEITVEVVAGRVAVVAGASSSDTARAIENSRAMKQAGATYVLHASPSYNKPPQRGIIAQVRAIADAAEIPVILYNVPGRTCSNVEAETTLALAEHENIVAIKEASGNIVQIGEIVRNRPEGFLVISGDDTMTLAVLAEGGDGVVSVTANVAPTLVAQLCTLARQGEWDDARAANARLAEWTSAAFVESNPIPVKAALSMMGMMQNQLRLPLVPLAESHDATIRRALVSIGALAA